MGALWRVNLILAFNRSLLNRKYTPINVLKALASFISMLNLHVTLLSKIAPRYLTLFTNGIFLPFNFDVVVELMLSFDPESYAGSSVPTGRVSHAGQIKDDPDTLVLQVGDWVWV
jgi:hypothetical protein